MMNGNYAQVKAIEKKNKEYKIDLTGERFGRLLVIEYAGKKKSGNTQKTMWRCKCDCGNESVVAMGQLRSGRTASCGCLQKEAVGQINRKHNLSNKCGRLYPLWKSIKYRCYCKTSKDYPNYGGRGITMCEAWKSDFLSFYKWAIANGYKEQKTDKGLNILTIDRIDVNGNYEPSNCRFVTNEVQSANKRNSMTDSEKYAICPICLKPYTKSQRNGEKTCSRSCGAKLRYRKMRSKNELQTNLCNES